MGQVNRRSVLIGASAAVAGALGGCTDGPSGPAPGPTVGTGSSQRLRGRVVVALERRPSEAAWQALVDAYRQRNPEVEIAWRTPEAGREYAGWLRAELDSDEPPDIVTGVELSDTSRSQASGAVPADGGTAASGLVDLDRYRGRVNPYTRNAWKNDLDFSVVRSVGGDRAIRTVGTERVRPVWFYNVAMFEAAGAEPPSTWAELMTACDALSASDPSVPPLVTSYPAVVRAWLAGAYFDQYHPEWVDMARARPGDWNYSTRLDGSYQWRPEEPRLHDTYTFSMQRFLRAFSNGELGYDTDAMTGLARNLARLLRSRANTDLFDAPDHRTAFLQQRAAMTVADSSLLSRLRLDLGGGNLESFPWDTFAFPAMSGAGAPSVVRSGERIGGYRASLVPAGPEQERLASDFLMFWFSVAGHEPFVQADGADFRAEGPSLLNGVEYPGAVADMLEAIPGPHAVVPQYGDFWLTGGRDPAIAADLEQLFRKLVNNERTPRQYVGDVQQYLERNLGDVLASLGLTSADLDAPQRRPLGVE